MGSSPTRGTCETSQVLLPGVPGGFTRSSPVFAPLIFNKQHNLKGSSFLISKNIEQGLIYHMRHTAACFLKTNTTYTEVSYLEFHLCFILMISAMAVFFPFLALWRSGFAVLTLIFQFITLIRFGRVCNRVTDFNKPNSSSRTTGIRKFENIF